MARDASNEPLSSSRSAWPIRGRYGFPSSRGGLAQPPLATLAVGPGLSCFTYFDSLANRPGVALGMQLQTGDMQFVNNFVTAHNRTAFVDDAEISALRRHLLRLWISRPEAGRPL